MKLSNTEMFVNANAEFSPWLAAVATVKTCQSSQVSPVSCQARAPTAGLFDG